MKQFNSYINEKLRIGKNTSIIKYKPETHTKLRVCVSKELKENGMDADLNVIDTSLITDMHDIFSAYPNFNGDVSDWDVSNVTNMRNMFNGCKEFNCDISKWQVENVTDMAGMFCLCKSFNQDLNNWHPESLKQTLDMFLYTPKLKKPEWFNKFS